MNYPGRSKGTPTTFASSSLPPYLARHANIGFDSDDVAALLNSIDASQKSHTSSSAQLPAELLLQILEFVPIDYVLTWRLVCRGFRNAIDGQILYHHLQRTQLIGFMGTQDIKPLIDLSDEEYEQVHLLRANFLCLEDGHRNESHAGPAWASTHAVFQIDDSWYQAFRHITGARMTAFSALQGVSSQWNNILDRLELQQSEEGFGTLRWCVKLDHAVFDMDFPLEAGRNSFNVFVDLRDKTVRVFWKDMLFGFLRTETALRQLMEKTETANFTFGHIEDCLRAVRRQRLFANLDPDNKIDRHIIWSLRLLRPLFGQLCHNHTAALAHVETAAVDLLMLLRREAAMSDGHVAYLHQLNEDRQSMERELHELEDQFKEFKAHMSRPGYEFTLPLSTSSDSALPQNPIAWPDDMRASIEDRVGKWRNQRKVIKQIHTLLSTSNQALGVPESIFDNFSIDI